MGSPEVTVPMPIFLSKELTVKGSFRYGPGDYPLAISLVSSGKIDVKPLITHRYVSPSISHIPLFTRPVINRFVFTDALKAFDTSRTGTGPDGKGVIKAIIDGPEDEPTKRL